MALINWSQTNWGQSNINFFKQWGQRLRGLNKWGQININLVNQKGQRLRGASSWWGTTNRQPPLVLIPFD
jgi:hypothetical protein